MRAALIAGTAMIALTGPAFAQSGPLVIYTSTPTEQMDMLVSRFNETYPDIEVEYFRSGTTEVINRLQSEFAAESPQPDLLLIADTVVMTALKNDDRLQGYQGAPVDGLNPDLYDSDMTFFGTKLITTGFAYNTELVDTPPTAWSDLTDPEIAGRLTMPSPLYSGAAAIHVGTMTELDQFGWDYYEALAENGAVAGRGNGGVLDAVARGEQSYGIIIDFMPLNARADGSPIDFVFPEEGVTSVTEPVAILSTATNVEAARAFVDWQLSEEGQSFHAEQGYLPLLPDVEGPEGFPALDDLTILSVDPARLLEADESMKRQFADLFGG
ncbi:ABC transporter substrate-binding protein [Fodinicurvata sp. EGI_FJ10296]|uniref:ABC transporter substrate-binding protein n=1 Tax=Fodinicurvata sp. EGI_FJ10296 TaxID=3231908 RepID=UPI0034536A3B